MMVSKVVDGLEEITDINLIDPLVALTTVMNFKRPYIVIVDDNKDFADLLELILSDRFAMFEFVKFYSARDAQKFVFKNRECISFIISDFHMDKTDGLRFFKNLQISGMQIPFLLISSDSSQKLQHEAINCGVQDFIPKTINFYEMINTINSYVRLVQAF
jgi:DNA-binding NtrC family response regulator